MNILIIGVGAMACLFGSYLAEQANVFMLGRWSQQIEALNGVGLLRIGPDGHQSRHFLPAVSSPADLPAADLVLILVKTPATARAARQSAAVCAGNGLVLTLQNGLGNREIITRHISAEQVLVGTTLQGATMLAPGKLRHAGTGPTMLGVTAATESAGDDIAALFTSAGIPTGTTREIAPLLWQKCAINAGINPLTALLDVKNGVLLQKPFLKSLMIAAAAETANVAAAQGIPISAAEIALATVNAALATARNSSSMRQDIQRGSETEIRAICGAVVLAGQQCGQNTPVNQFLLTAVSHLESGHLRFPAEATTAEKWAHLRSLYSIPE